jgi:hypothetical protein
MKNKEKHIVRLHREELQCLPCSCHRALAIIAASLTEIALPQLPPRFHMTDPETTTPSICARAMGDWRFLPLASASDRLWEKIGGLSDLKALSSEPYFPLPSI